MNFKHSQFKNFIIAASFVLISFYSIHSSFARPGDLDSSFGFGGIALHAFPLTCVDRPCNNSSNFPSIIKTAQGKYLISGYAYVAGDRSRNATSYLARLNADGSVDETFGSFGFIQEMNPSTTGFLIKSLGNGKILKAGTYSLERLNSNGSIDRSFGINGMAENLGATYGSAAEGAAIGLQSDGKILIALERPELVGSDRTFRPFIARYLSTGYLDRNFGDSGYAIFPLDRSRASTHIDGAKTPAIGELLQLPDGRVLASAYPNRSIQLAVYDEHGRLDPRFASASSTPGILQESRGLEMGGTTASALQGTGITPEGKILKAMNIFSILPSANAPEGYLIIISLGFFRYNADGTPDNSFGTNGFFLIRNVDYMGEALRILPNGKILVAAETKGLGAHVPFHPPSGDVHSTLLSFNSDGSPDSDFGMNGRVETPIGDFDLFKNWILEEPRLGLFNQEIPECKITVLGTVTGEWIDLGRYSTAPTHNETTLVRYNLGDCGTTFHSIITPFPPPIYYLPLREDYFKPRPIEPEEKIQTEKNLNQN